MWPDAAPRRVGAAAFALSAAIELLQLAGVAGALVDGWAPLRLVFGQSFVAADFIAYALGAALAVFVDLRSSPTPSEDPAPNATSARPAG